MTPDTGLEAEPRSDALLACPDDPLVDHAFEDALTGRPLRLGNSVQLLTGGFETYEAMFEALLSAERYILLESYIFEADEVGTRFAQALIAARARGVDVAVIVDGVGSADGVAALFDQMRAAGIPIVVFNPINPMRVRRSWSPNERDHRKVLIVDGRIGFMGGINVSSVYSSKPSAALRRRRAHVDPRTAPWRDTDIALKGPVLRDLEALFRGAWDEQDGPPLPDWPPLTGAGPPGDTAVRILAGDPRDERGRAIYHALLASLSCARRTVHITMAYFVPDPVFKQALVNAARRGVEVTLVLPSFSDFWMVFHAGRSHYAELLQAGVHIHERHGAMLHAKTAVIDGHWSTVGSSNLDWRSFALNHEVNAVVLGARFGAQMEALFADDLAHCVCIRLEDWRHRPVLDRLRERFARLWERWL